MLYQTGLLASLLLPILIPILAIVGILLTRRSDEDQAFAVRVGVVAVFGALITFFEHNTFGGYGVTISLVVTAVGLLAYWQYAKRASAY